MAAPVRNSFQRQHFFTDSSALFIKEVLHADSLHSESDKDRVPAPKSGKTARLISTLVQYAEQQDRQDSGKETQSVRHGLRTWLYGPCVNLEKDDEELMKSFEYVVTGEQNKVRAWITNLRLGSSRKQLRPLHVEAAVLLSVITASGMPIVTRHLWKYRKVLSKAVGGTPEYIEFGIRAYDRSVHQVVSQFLLKLSQRFQAQPVSDGTTSPRPQVFEPHNLQHIVSKNRSRWTEHTRKKAAEVAVHYVKRLSEATASLNDMIAQFWDNLASMTYPIRKFEHGRNRFIFRLATGELCTGTTIKPKLTLEEFETSGGVSGATAPNVKGRVLFRKMKPNLQPITSDYAIDCSVNVFCGRRRVLGMLERRALRMCMTLANYTRYNLDITENSNGIFRAAGLPGEGDPARNMAPDLVALFLCNQTVSVVRYKGINVITGFIFRGQHVELLYDEIALHAEVREQEAEPYHEIVERLTEEHRNGREELPAGGRNIEEGATGKEVGSSEAIRTQGVTDALNQMNDVQNSEHHISEHSRLATWKADVCGAVRVLATAKSVFLLTRIRGGEHDNTYRLHELSDVMAYDFRTSIFVL